MCIEKSNGFWDRPDNGTFGVAIVQTKRQLTWVNLKMGFKMTDEQIVRELVAAAKLLMAGPKEDFLEWHYNWPNRYV